MDGDSASQRLSKHGEPHSGCRSSVLRSLERPVSPPQRSRKPQSSQASNLTPSTSAVESGESYIHDPLSFFSAKLLSYSHPAPPVPAPRLAYEEWVALYKRNNQQPHGRHFVIHQHDHPVAGIHYDLRLQCNEVSSVSWAVVYGMPGDPNSVRLNRGAVETRVHSLWNHLIETASHSTGSTLIWDTGEYSILPYYQRRYDENENLTSDSEREELDAAAFDNYWNRLTDNEKLRLSFSKGKIRMRLHGSRLPRGYTIGIWLAKGERYKSIDDQPQKPRRKRKRIDPTLRVDRKTYEQRCSDSEDDTPPAVASISPSTTTEALPIAESSLAMPSEDDSEAIRLANAYAGAVNDVGSVHQRRWYLSLDREKSGFHRPRGSGKPWVRNGEDQGFEPFHVRGRDVERSVVTGRLGQEILEDEGVEGYVPRGRWRPVLE